MFRNHKTIQLFALVAAALVCTTVAAQAASPSTGPSVSVRITGPATVTAGKYATFKVVVKTIKNKKAPAQLVGVSNSVDGSYYAVDQKIKFSPAIPSSYNLKLGGKYNLWITSPLTAGVHSWSLRIMIPNFDTGGGNMTHVYCLSAGSHDKSQDLFFPSSAGFEHCVQYKK